jgi:hypothetical protein
MSDDFHLSDEERARLHAVIEALIFRQAQDERCDTSLGTDAT